MKAGSGPPFSFDPPIRLHIGYSSGQSPRSDLNGDEGHYARRTSMSRCSQKCPQSTPVPSHPHGFAVKLRADSRLKHSQFVCNASTFTFGVGEFGCHACPLVDSNLPQDVAGLLRGCKLYRHTRNPPFIPLFHRVGTPSDPDRGPQITLAHCLWANIFTCWIF